MKRKIDNIFLVIVLLVLTNISPTYSQDTLTIEHVFFDKELGKITGYRGNSKNIAIPNQLEIDNVNYPVNIIGKQSFYGRELTDVNIQEGIKIIEGNAFRLNQLTNITIPSSVVFLGFFSFAQNLITNISIPESFIEIERGVLNDNSIEKINNDFSNGIIFKRDSTNEIDSTTIISYGGSSDSIYFIPETVKIIDENAFSFSGINYIDLPDNLEFIGEWAFRLNNLENVTLPNSLLFIGEKAFYTSGCISIELPDSVIKEDATFIEWKNGFNESVTEITNFDTYYVAKFTTTTGLKNSISNNIIIFPNPTTNVLHFSSPIESYFIINNMGQVLLFSKADNSKNSFKTIDVSFINSGLYSIIYVLEGVVYNNNFIIER